MHIKKDIKNTLKIQGGSPRSGKPIPEHLTDHFQNHQGKQQVAGTNQESVKMARLSTGINLLICLRLDI